MAFDYPTLIAAKSTRGSIQFWANHASVDSDGILTQAQAWITERLRSREMRTSQYITLPNAAYNLALTSIPTVTASTDFMDPIGLKWRGDMDDLAYVHEKLLGRFINQGDTAPPNGRPIRYAIFDEKLQFEVTCDEAAGLIGDFIFYKRPAVLSVGNPTNFLTVRFPLLLRRICTALAYEDRKRDATTEYALAEQSIAEANIAEDMNRRGQVLR